MKIRYLALAGVFCCGMLSAANAASGDSWVGAWGYPPAPLPPGETPVNTVPNPATTAMPLGPLPEIPRATPAAPPVVRPPLLDNPGNVPVDNNNSARAGAAPSDITVREIVRVSAAAKKLRLRFTNEEGSEALILGAVHVGEAGPDGSIVAGTDRAVTFGGHAGVTIPSSAPLLSDPVDLPVEAIEKLAVSVYLPGPMARSPRSLWEYASSQAGNLTAAASLPGVHLIRAPAFVSEVEIDNSTAQNVVVTLGDSITEGAQSTANAFRGWPDRLAERLAATRAGKNWAVVNAGIGGNRLLRYGTGPDAPARLDRDVLSVPGVKVIILLEGINDIGRAYTTRGATEPATAEALEAADLQIIARAHEHGIRVIGATLTPYENAAYYSPDGEKVRAALNQWIRTGGAFDGFVDFDAATRDAADPIAYRAGFNEYDHLHPNDTGYKAMGNAIDLKLITGQ